jgi:tetratricopeptide (TPR) repeat protein
MKRALGVALAAAVLAAPPRAFADPAKAEPAPAAVSAGMAQADAQFQAGRWAEAAVAYHRVARGETGDGAHARRLAAYRVAVTLHYLGLHQASLGAFAPIADDPSHPRFGETLVWLAGLSTVIAEPDEAVALLGKYGPDDAAIYDNPTQRQLHARLLALIGRHAYRARRFDDAIRAFAKVAPESPSYVEAEFLTALSHLQLRKAVPAMLALRLLQGELSRRPPSPERSRLLDLVHLSRARVDYSRALAGAGASCCGRSIDVPALRAAAESYRRVDSDGASWPDALFESSWVHFMTGDHARALGNLEAYESPVLRRFANPEVPVLQGMIAFSLCEYATAARYAAQAKARWEPVRREIAGVVARLEAEGGAARFFAFPGDLAALAPIAARLSADARALVERALSDRQLQRRFAHARDAEAEIAQLARMPAWFRRSALGVETADALDLARDLAMRNAGGLVRARLLRVVDGMDQHLREASALATDAAQARDETKKREPSPAEPPLFPPATAGDEHVVWPFDGEFWGDELGSYRVAARSRCAR